MSQERVADHPIDRLFLDRWSPRSFTGEAISEADLLTILEAARWAPSSYNVQPWRFIYARRDTPHWATFLDLLVPFNQSWAKNTAALIIIASRKTMKQASGEEKPSHSHSFDAGAAWAAMALQATLSGWHAHGMVGFDIPRAQTQLSIPENFRVEAAIAIGRRGSADALPPDQRAREVPNDRLPLTATAFAGSFPASAS